MDRPVIFWDFDGTLVKPNQSFLFSLEQAFLSCGIPPDRQRSEAFLKSACSWYFPEQSYVDATGESWWQALLHRLSSFCGELSLSREQTVWICSRFREGCMAYPYVPYEDALKTLCLCKARGYGNFLLSNNFPELMASAEKLGFSPYLEGCFLSSCLGYEKPRKELFQLAAEKAGSPEKTFMVGDNPVADMKGGKEAGLTTILVHREDACLFADFKVSSLSSILSLL